MLHLSLTFFGSFQATLDHQPITNFRSARVQGLLVYMALNSQHPYDREALAALFWPEEPESVAKKNLRQSLYQLRQALGESDSQDKPYLLTTRSTAQFNPACDHSLDVDDFLSSLDSGQLDQAVNLYQGELLPGFTCDSLPFEEWLREQRERLHRLALQAMFELTARCLARADYRAAQGLARRQLALEPWREGAHRQLMQALAQQGDRSAALAQYDLCRQVLQEELGVQPTDETQALADRIRDQQLGQPGMRGLTPSSGRRRLNLPFVGRVNEHRTLVNAYQRSREQGLQVVALLGEAGIGKTRLAQTFLNWAATHEADILTGQAFETSGRLSYQPLTQALRQRLERENAPEDLLSDLWLTQLTRILPELRDRYPDLPEPTQDQATAQEHLFEGITRLGLSLAERAPLILFIDDWHWADAGSLDVLHYAALRWAKERAPILLVLTLRREALAENRELDDWLTRLRHDVTCTLLYLGSLSVIEIRQLIQSLVEGKEGGGNGPQDEIESSPKLARFCSWLFEETDGQPFFLMEMLKALKEAELIQPAQDSGAWHVDWQRFDDQALNEELRVLPGVREIIKGWLERISHPAGELLIAAAVLDKSASFDRLTRVAGLGETQALNALDELLAGQLLLEQEETPGTPISDVAYGFSHQKLREVVYDQASAARRKVMHRRAYETLKDSGASSAELAHHASLAGMVVETIRYSLAAGDEAMQLFAARVAIEDFEIAWRIIEATGWPQSIPSTNRQAFYTQLGRAYELTEDWRKAQEVYRAMIAEAEATRASGMQCMGLNRLATVAINGLKDPQQATELLERARTVAEESEDLGGLAETEWNLSLAARLQQQSDQILPHGERALALARQLEQPQLLARSLNSLAYAHARLRHWHKVENYAAQAQQIYAAAGNRIMASDCQRLVGWTQMYTGRPKDSLATLREAYTFSLQIENTWGEAECSWRLALTLTELGCYGEAIGLARRSVEQARQVGVPTMMLMAASTLGAILRRVMSLTQAKEILSGALAESTAKGMTDYIDWPLAELCALHTVAGNWEQACEYARQIANFREGEKLLPVSLTGWHATQALLRGGEGDLARGQVARLAEIVGENRRYRLPLLRSRAVLAHWEGDISRSVACLEEARGLARAMSLPGEEWPILKAMADLYSEQGDKDEAHRAHKESAAILGKLADSMDEGELRAGFLASEPVRTTLEDY